MARALCLVDSEGFRQTLNNLLLFHGNVGTANVPEHYVYMYIAFLVNTVQWHYLFMKSMTSITFLYINLYHY